MSRLQRVARGGAGVLMASLLMLAVSACNQISTVTVSKGQILGTWTSEQAGSIDLRDGSRFSTTGLTFGRSILDGCESGLTTGGWDFYTDGESGITDPDLTSGPVIGLLFDGKDAECFFDLYARESGGKTELCLTVDPDYPCADGIDFSKENVGRP